MSGLGRRAFRETAYQVQAQQRITFVVWDSGARSWALTFGTQAAASTPSAGVSDDKTVRVARSITAELPTGQ